MFPSDLDNAYAYEVERRKDEMRDAAKSQYFKPRRSSAWLVAILSIFARLMTILIGP